MKSNRTRKIFIIPVGILVAVILVFTVFSAGYTSAVRNNGDNAAISSQQKRLDFKDLNNPLESSWDNLENRWHSAWDNIEDDWHSAWDSLEDSWNSKWDGLDLKRRF